MLFRSTSTTTTTATGTSGAGGGGGQGQGGAGGSGSACLDGAVAAPWFTLQTDELCVVEAHHAAVLVGYDPNANFYLRVPTWGRHGGPLTLTPVDDGTITLSRWAVPSDPQGELVGSDTVVDAGLAPGVFVGAQGQPPVGARGLPQPVAARPGGEAEERAVQRTPEGRQQGARHAVALHHRQGFGQQEIGRAHV